MQIIKNRTYLLYYIFVWVLGIAFIADSTNLDDLIPNNYVYHSDDPIEDYSLLLTSETLVQPRSDKSNSTIVDQINKKLAKISYDLDSPFIEDGYNTKIESSIPLTSKEQIIYQNCVISQPLYLLYCSLQI
jgi:hypothetical protein